MNDGVSPQRRKPRVVYWFDRPTPTPMQRCNAVHELGALDFEVWFNRRSDGGSFQQWQVSESDFAVPYRYVPGIRALGYELPIPASAMIAARPDLIVHDYWPWPLALGVLASKATATRTALRVLPNYDNWSRRTRFGELSKQFIFRAVDGAKVPGPDGAAFAGRYGLPLNRTCTVTQSVDTQRFGVHEEQAARRDRVRRRLGLSGCTFLFVGRLWTGKGLDQLFDAYAQLSRQRSDVSLVLVGDGPDEARYRARAEQLQGVTFAGWVERELPLFFAASDALVFPTLGDPNGLVVEEAMVAGLPVITSDLAGDIRARVNEPERGFVVPTTDTDLLCRRMAELAEDPGLRRAMGDAGACYAAQKDHRRYAREFVEFVERIMELPPRRTPAAYAARAAGSFWTRAYSRFAVRDHGRT